MKQKVVVKVNMNEHKKARSKALKIAVGVQGVVSAALQGPDKDQIVVTGEGIDSVELTTLLRKNVGHTELVTVGPVEEEKKDKPAAAAAAATVDGSGSVIWSAHPYYSYGGMQPLQIYEVPPTEPPSCSIM